MTRYAVPVIVQGRYWAVKVLIDADTPEHAKGFAVARMGPLLAAAGVRDAAERFVVGEPEQL